MSYPQGSTCLAGYSLPRPPLARPVLKCEEKEDSMVFMIGGMFGLAFEGGWILSEVRHLSVREGAAQKIPIGH